MSRPSGAHLRVVRDADGRAAPDTGADPSSFHEIYRHHSGYVAGLAGRILGRNHEVPAACSPTISMTPRGFGGACDLSINGPSNAMLQKSLGAAFIARRRGARLGSELGLGARVGNVEFDGGPAIGKQTNVWGGAFGTAALLLQVNKPLAIRAAVELGFPIEGPGFGFHGPWGMATLGTSVVF